MKIEAIMPKDIIVEFSKDQNLPLSMFYYLFSSRTILADNHFQLKLNYFDFKVISNKILDA